MQLKGSKVCSFGLLWMISLDSLGLMSVFVWLKVGGFIETSGGD